MAIAMLEPALPIWMMETMCSKKWQLGKVQHVIFVQLFIWWKSPCWFSHAAALICSGAAATVSSRAAPQGHAGDLLLEYGVTDATEVRLANLLFELRFLEEKYPI